MFRAASASVLVALVLALLAAGPAGAQTPPEPVIADGVTVAGVAVGGLTAAEATAAIQAFFNQPLTVTVRTRVIQVTPQQLRSRPRVYNAVTAALAAPADTALGLDVVVSDRTLRSWLNRVAGFFDRRARSTRAILVGLRPRLTEAKPGRELMRYYARLRLRAALRKHDRDVTLPVRTLRPSVTPGNFGPAIVIRRETKRLILYRGSTAGPMRFVTSFPIATGMAAYPTPLGSFRIVTRQRNPWWNPPAAEWASGAQPIPPGPGNPLGTRWMGLSVGSVGIHGTPDAASIGYSASHGCIRMRIPDAEWLFERVRVGTPVFIVRA